MPDSEVRRAAVWAGLLIGAAILTRTVGLVFLPAVILYALAQYALAQYALALYGRPLRRPPIRTRSSSSPPEAPRAGGRPKGRPYMTAAWIVGVAAIVSAPWFAAVAAHRGLDRVGYLREFAGTTTRAGQPAAEPADRPAANVRDLGERVADTPLPPALRELGPPWTDAARAGYLVLCGIAAALVLAGFGRGLLVRRGIEEAYALCYVAVLAFWLPGGFRLLLPLYPLLLLYLCDGVLVLGARVPGLRQRDPGDTARARRLEAAGRTALVLTIAANLVVTFLFPRIERRVTGEYAPWWSDYLRTVCTVGALAREGDTVLTRPANVPFYLTGMQAARLRAADRDDLAGGVVRSGARYIVLTPGLRGVLGPEFVATVRRSPDRFAPVARFGAVEAFAVLPNVAQGTPPPAAPPAAGPLSSAAPSSAARNAWSARCRAVVP